MKPSGRLRSKTSSGSLSALSSPELWDDSLISLEEQGNLIVSLKQAFLDEIPFYKVRDNKSPLLGLQTDSGFRVFILAGQAKQGGEGAIYPAQNLETGQWVIVKEIRPLGQPEVFVEPEKRALISRKRLIGQHVHRMGDESEHRYFLVMPMYPGCTLSEYIYWQDSPVDQDSSEQLLQKRDIEAGQLKSAVRGLLLEVKACHKAGFAHMDLNPSNVLIDLSAGGVSVNIVDYGCMRDQHTLDMGMTETFGYLAPEMQGGASSRRHFSVDSFQKADLFSVGVMVAEMISNSCLYRTFCKEKIAVIEHREGFRRPIKIEEITQALWDVFDPDASVDTELQVLRQMAQTFCQADPSNRHSIDWALDLLKPKLPTLDLAKIGHFAKHHLSPRPHNAPSGTDSEPVDRHASDTDTAHSPRLFQSPPLMRRHSEEPETRPRSRSMQATQPKSCPLLSAGAPEVGFNPDLIRK